MVCSSRVYVSKWKTLEYMEEVRNICYMQKDPHNELDNSRPQFTLSSITNNSFRNLRIYSKFAKNNIDYWVKSDEKDLHYSKFNKLSLNGEFCETYRSYDWLMNSGFQVLSLIGYNWDYKLVYFWYNEKRIFEAQPNDPENKRMLFD